MVHAKTNRFKIKFIVHAKTTHMLRSQIYSSNKKFVDKNAENLDKL